MGQDTSKEARSSSKPRAIAPTQSPVRLCMFSEREMVSMEVRWCDTSSAKQRWSSEEDNFCTPYEAEKILPSCATNISVEFFVCSDGSKTPVYKKGTAVKESLIEPVVERIELRLNPSKIVANDRGASNNIDAIFTLDGCGYDCHVKSAWNRAGEPRSWEIYDDKSERPDPALPLLTLIAADNVPAPPLEFMNAASGVVLATNRLVAALKALQEVRRVGLKQFQDIDQGFDLQWWLVNIGNTCSLASDTASALTAVCSPTTSAITGFIAASFTSSAWVYDVIGEGMRNKRVRQAYFWMLRECMAVQELEKQWQKASKLAEDEQVLSSAIEYGQLGSAQEVLKTICGNTFCITFDVASSTASCFPVIPVKIPLYLTWIGVVGCFLVCANGWVEQKQSQKTVKEMALALQKSMDKTDEYLSKPGAL